jgi:hypothetical protein
MPLVFRHDGLRYFFYSNEGAPRELPHVHVVGGSKDAKVWIEPEVAIARSYGFSPRELSSILRTVSKRRDLIRRLWRDYFGDGRPV